MSVLDYRNSFNCTWWKSAPFLTKLLNFFNKLCYDFRQAGGIWILVVWAELVWYHVENKYYISDISPSFFILTNEYCILASCVIPILCGVYLIVATIWRGRKLSRYVRNPLIKILSLVIIFCLQYYVISSWTLVFPISYSIYFIFYLKNVDAEEFELILRGHLKTFNPKIDAKKWDELQTDVRLLIDCQCHR